MIHELQQIMAPPATRIDANYAEVWRSTEAVLGTELPADYKAFARAYGAGEIDEWLFVFSPFTSVKGYELLKQIRAQLDALRQLREEFHVHLPYPIFPETGGVMPWGCTGNGDVLYWTTIGHPSEWTVCLREGRGPDWEAFSESMTGFLVKLLKGEIRVGIFADDVSLSPSSRFIPAR